MNAVDNIITENMIEDIVIMIEVLKEKEDELSKSIKELQDKKKQYQEEIEKSKKHLVNLIADSGSEYIKTNNYIVRNKVSESVVVSDKFDVEKHKNFTRIKIEPDKRLIKKAIKDGILSEDDGVTIEKKKIVQIENTQMNPDE